MGMAKEKEDLKALQVNGNSNSLSLSSESNNVTLNDSKDGSNKPKAKKGALWAMPIVPKPPQKPNEKRKSQSSIATSVIPNSVPAVSKKTESANSSSRPKNNSKENSSPTKSGKTAANDNNDAGNGALVDVWRQAFGAVKPKKPVEASPLNNKLLIKQEIDAETCKKITYLDIPSEVRRRPKPAFGGLIHFPPDWERAVKRHHGKCRLPNQLIRGIKANPQILCKNNVVYDNKQLSPGGKDMSSAPISQPS